MYSSRFERVKLHSNPCYYVEPKLKGMKKKQNESHSVDLLGNSFVAFPRIVFDLQFSPKKTHRSAGILYAALISKVYFKQGWVKLQDRTLKCRQGEYITTRQSLSEYAGLRMGTLHKALGWLVKEGFIVTQHLPGCTSFFLCGYDHFYKNLKSKTTDTQSVSVSLNEAERRMGGRSMQFDEQKGQKSGKEQA